MVRPPSVDSNGMKKGAWSEEEDNKLRAYVLRYGHWNWRLLPKFAGLARCGKSCRLRWVNYLKPGLKRGDFTKEEEDIVIKMHALLGNKWSAIAAKLHGRTDNEIKNFYHTRIEKHRKKNPSAKKDKQHDSCSEASSHENQVLDGGKGFEFSEYQKTHVESAFSEATSTNKLQESTLSSDHTQSQEDLRPDMLQMDTNYSQIDSFPPLIVDDFFNPELHYTDLSSPGSSYMSALDWIADDDHHSNISSSSNACSYYQSESPTGVYDPLFQCFDYGMDLFS